MSTTGSHEDPDDHRWLVLGICCLSLLIVGTDTTIVNVALPAIHRSLHASLSGLQWIVDAYTLVLGSFLMLGGSTGDRLGRRRVFQTGLVTFVIGSALCAAAPSIGVLIVARALQGVSGALLTPAALAIIVSVFPRNERGAAIGKWTAWGGIGILAGPLLGGQIVDSASWRWIFVINVPLVMIALFLSRIAVPGRAQGMSGAGRHGIDWLGAAFAATGLAGISFGLIEQPVLGWSDPGVWGALVIGLVMLATFIYHEAHTAAPMLPLG
ncbi:MAG: MFS transporter, partial [Acetobacteraceae bacterium]